MAAELSHPLRLGPAGEFVTVEQFGPEGLTEAVAALVLTRRGERPLLPGYGLTDPTFAHFEPTELAAQVAAWAPEATVLEASVRVGDDVTTVDVRLI